MARNKRNSDLTAASDVLQGLLENGKMPLSNSFNRWKLARRWELVVGDTIAEHSEPISYYNGTLYVWVENSAWLQQLNFMSEQIRSKVNESMGEGWARKVRFKLDRSI